MRHRKRRTKLGMMTSRRNATLRNMVKSLLEHQRIETTLRRAKETRRLADRVISLGKVDSVASRRIVYSILDDRNVVSRLFKEIAPLFKNRAGGYTRIIPLGFRRGDGANLAILELTEKKAVEEKPTKKKEKPKPDAAEEKKEKKAEPKMKTMPKAKPTPEEEKKAEKAKTEDRKIEDKKSFLKNLRGFFRRKTNM